MKNIHNDKDDDLAEKMEQRFDDLVSRIDSLQRSGAHIRATLAHFENKLHKMRSKE